MILFILSHPVYKTLDFAAGFIGGTYIESINADVNFGNMELSNIRMARITFNVRLIESNTYEKSIELLGNDTDIKLEMTSKGYKLTFNN